MSDNRHRSSGAGIPAPPTSDPPADSSEPPGSGRDPRKRNELLRRLFAMTWEHRGLCVRAMAWDLTVQVLVLLSSMYSGLGLDVLHHYKSPAEAPEPHWPLGIHPSEHWGLLELLALACGLILILAALRMAANFKSRLADEGLIQEITVDLRKRLYDKMQRMNFRYFDTHDTGGLINRVTGDASSVRNFVQGVILQLIISLSTLVIFLAYMFSANAWLTLAVLAVIPLQFRALLRYGRQVSPRIRAVRDTMDTLIQYLQESIIGVKVVKGFGQEPQMAARFHRHNQAAASTRMEVAQIGCTNLPWIPASSVVQIAILLGLGGYFVMRGPDAGGITLGTLWVFLSLVRQLSSQVDIIVSSTSGIPEALTGAERVFELLDAPIEIESPSAPGRAYAPEQVRGAISFRNVSFRYGPQAPLVLENISFDVEPGETVAIVGPAGSGKSTLLELVPRLYDVSGGCVMIDGRDVREWDLPVLRHAVGFVYQEPFLFSNSVANNVRFGDMNKDAAAIWRSLDHAAAREFIESADRQLDTIIGERGLNLSGGERQRLSLARALILAPAVLLLDDAMSAVDARTEGRIQDSLSEIMRHRTTLIISHRLSTLRRADRVIVIEHGRLSSMGTHEELMLTNEHYRRAAQLQLEREQFEERQEMSRMDRRSESHAGDSSPDGRDRLPSPEQVKVR